MSFNVESDTIRIAECMAMDLAQHGFVESIELIKDTSDASLSGPYGTVVRTYLPEYDLKKLGSPRISVLPITNRSQHYARARTLVWHTIDTHVQQHVQQAKGMTFQASAERTGDRLQSIVQGVQRFFEDKVCICRARWLNYETEDLFSLEEINTEHRIAIAIRHTWIMMNPRRRAVENPSNIWGVAKDACVPC